MSMLNGLLLADDADEQASSEAPCSTRPPLALIDLFNDAETLATLLCAQVADQHWLDAFLLAAGVQQILEDHWHRDHLGIRRAGGQFARMEGSGAHVASAVAERADQFDLKVRSLMPSEANRRLCSRQLTWLVHELCRAVMHMGSVPESAVLCRQASAVRDALGTHMLCGGDIVRLPSCFRSFDQRPQDVERLAASFAEQWPERRCPLTVVGVRTSGNYLAPLGVVALQHLGYSNVIMVTIRPGWPIPAVIRTTIRHRAGAGGMFLVMDDPPATGRSLAVAVGQIRAAGVVPDERIAVLAALSADSNLPGSALGGASVVRLPWDEWDVHRQLTATQVCETVTNLLPIGVSVRRAEAIGSATRPERGHVRACFQLGLVDASTGNEAVETIVVEGVGLGYLGRHATAVAQAAPELVPHILGFTDGMLYRQWLPEMRSCMDADGGKQSQARAASSIASHIALRKEALRVPVDCSLALGGRQPAWEVASSVIGRSLGALSLPMRIPVVDPLARRLLCPTEPSIVDGNTMLDQWFLQGDRVALKVDFAEGPFSHLDLATYDAVFDLAGAAVSSASSSFAGSLRAAYTCHTGKKIDPERWMLYQLVHLWNATRLGRTTPPIADRLSSQIVQGYFAERFLDDLPTPPTGPFAALDLDGVLETSPLGFPATTKVGALALRALRAHNVRILLVTGRSLAEVVERCDTYGASGGVAEYGAVAYDHSRRSVTELVLPAGTRVTEQLRAHTATLADVEVDGDYKRIVRAFQRGPTGRHGLDAETVDALVRAMAAQGQGQRLFPLLGEMQTDFVPTGIDKGHGLCVLLNQLGHEPDHEAEVLADGCSSRPAVNNAVTLAVGDSPSDVGFLRLADRAIAPANAHPDLRAQGVEIVRGAYQSGLFQAVERLLGHRPGSCEVCRPPTIPRPAQDLVALLSFQENGWHGVPARLASIAARAFAAWMKP